MSGIFDGEEVISVYTRAQAIADGVLVDVTPMANEAGFRTPVALTSAVWSNCVRVPDGVRGQDEDGRLWDVLWMCRLLISRAREQSDEILFKVHVRNNNRRGVPPMVSLKAVIGPGDAGEAVITIMMEDED